MAPSFSLLLVHGRSILPPIFFCLDAHFHSVWYHTLYIKFKKPFFHVCGFKFPRPNYFRYNFWWERNMLSWPFKQTMTMVNLWTLLMLKWGCASQSTNAESGWPAHPPLLWPRGLLYFTINDIWGVFDSDIINGCPLTQFRQLQWSFKVNY